MRMELYKIDKPPGADLKSRISHIVAQGLLKRNRTTSTGMMRLEALEKRGSLLLMDFVKIRMDHGPSKAGEDCPAQGFELGPAEGFGEETAMLWNTSNDWCVLQYNHHGCRAKSIIEYLSNYFHDAPMLLALSPKIDDEIHAKIMQKKHVSKVSISLAPKQVSDADFDAGASLGQAAKLLRAADADHIEITISAHRRNRLYLALPDFMKWIEHVGGNSEHSPIGSAHATARANDDDKPEVLDLLHSRIVTEEALTPGVDKRYSMKDRFDAIHRAHDGWTNLMV